MSVVGLTEWWLSLACLSNRGVNFLPRFAPVLVSCLLICMAVFATGGVSYASDLDIDYLQCLAPISPGPPLDSRVYDGISTSQLEHDAFWQVHTDARALLRHRVLGERYERDTPQYLDKAIAHYRRAAFVIGSTSSIYSPGVGGAPGSTSVSSSGVKSAGDPIAIRRLGEMYRDGVGMPADPRRAQRLLDCAARLMPPMQVPGFVGSNADNPARSLIEPPMKTWKSIPKPTVGSVMLDNQIATLSLPKRVRAIRWSPDGTQMAAIYGDTGRFVTLLDVHSGKQLWSLERSVGQTRRALQFSPDGEWLYTSSVIMGYKLNPETTISVVSTNDGVVARTFSYKTPRSGSALPQDILISNDGHKLFTVPGMTNEVIAYASASGSVTKTFLSQDNRHECGTGLSFSRIAIDEARGHLWFAHQGAVELWSLSGDQAEHLIQAFSVSVTAMQVWSKTGELIAGGNADFMQCRYPDNQYDAPLRNYQDDPATLVRAFDPNSGRLTRTFVGPGGAVEGLSLDSHRGVLAAIKSRMLGGQNAYLLLWDLASANLIAAKDFGQSDGLGDVAFDNQGSRIAYVDGTEIRILQIER